MCYNKYRRKDIAELRPYVEGEDLTGVSVSERETLEVGGMIARNPQDHGDRWYVAKLYFENNFEKIK